jgi:hypothetical protein
MSPNRRLVDRTQSHINELSACLVVKVANGEAEANRWPWRRKATFVQLASKASEHHTARRLGHDINFPSRRTWSPDFDLLQLG